MEIFDQLEWKQHSHLSMTKYYLNTEVAEYNGKKYYRHSKTFRSKYGFGLGSTKVTYSETMDSPDLTEQSLRYLIQKVHDQLNQNENTFAIPKQKQGILDVYSVCFDILDTGYVLLFLGRNPYIGTRNGNPLRRTKRHGPIRYVQEAPKERDVRLQAVEAKSLERILSAVGS